MPVSMMWAWSVSRSSVTLEERGDDLGSLRQWEVDGRDDDYLSVRSPPTLKRSSAQTPVGLVVGFTDNDECHAGHRSSIRLGRSSRCFDELSDQRGSRGKRHTPAWTACADVEVGGGWLLQCKRSVLAGCTRLGFGLTMSGWLSLN